MYRSYKFIYWFFILVITLLLLWYKRQRIFDKKCLSLLYRYFNILQLIKHFRHQLTRRPLSSTSARLRSRNAYYVSSFIFCLRDIADLIILSDKNLYSARNNDVIGECQNVRTQEGEREGTHQQVMVARGKRTPESERGVELKGGGKHKWNGRSFQGFKC